MLQDEVKLLGALEGVFATLVVKIWQMGGPEEQARMGCWVGEFATAAAMESYLFAMREMRD